MFRSATAEVIPLLDERLTCLREAGKVLYEVMQLICLDTFSSTNTYKRFDCTFLTCINEAKGSAAALVNLIVSNFPCFRDEARFEGQTIRFYKRAQILVADLWACFDGEGYGRFDDINKITMFAGSSPTTSDIS